MALPDIKEKVGPLPMWAWIVLGGVALFVLAAIAKGRGSAGGGTTLPTTGGTIGSDQIVNGVPVEQATKAVEDQKAADQSIIDQLKQQIADLAAQFQTATQGGGAPKNTGGGPGKTDPPPPLDVPTIGDTPPSGGSGGVTLPIQNPLLGKLWTAPETSAPVPPATPAPTPVYVPPVLAPIVAPVQTVVAPIVQSAQTGFQYLADGSVKFLKNGEILPAWATTRVTTRQGTTVILPSIYDPNQDRAGGIFTNTGKPEDAMNRITRLLGDLQAGGTVASGQVSNDPTDPRNVFAVMSRVLGDAAKMGFGGTSTGFVQGDRYY